MAKVNKRLFWDVEFKKLNYEKHADFVIKRVLQYGDVEDYKAIKKEYGLKKIKKVAQKINYFDKKSQNFWKFVFDI
ncbi:MAG: hypothetical protein CMI55_03095 [Parcubacteria group bacterium]|jgi:hypothetical protein|nr:hypothetical protein [Parcubacteria group bacterium]|tara:strand:- start:3492 stop:3719 length:228 start_codon:yes stop_codon:yes gene_type:complete